MTGLRVLHPRTIRYRFAAAYGAGVVVSGLAAFALVLGVLERSLFEEFEHRAAAIAERTARAVALPLASGDAAALEAELARVGAITDVAGIELLDAGGGRRAILVRDPSRWPATAPAAPATTARRLRARGGTVLEAVVRVPAPPGAPVEPTGTIRVALSGARADAAIAHATRVGAIVVLAVFAVGFALVLILARLVARPLREAGELARHIAAGDLARRIPVRGDDELGALAAAMNTMAVALADARRREREESAALRAAADAVNAVALGARGARDLEAVFRIVAEAVRGLGRAEALALIARESRGAPLRFRHFDPPAGWAGLHAGAPPGAALLAALAAAPTAPAAVADPGGADPVLAGLVRDGWRQLVLVPIRLEDGAGGGLLVGARSETPFGDSELRVIEGLASHLSSAIVADELRRQLERAYRELGQAREQLSRAEKLEATGALAAGVAHDFNNVLGAILGRLQLLSRAAAAGSLERDELARALEAMEGAAREGAETVRRLAEFGRATADPAAARADVADALREAVVHTRPRWHEEAAAEGRIVRVQLDAESGMAVALKPEELREVVVRLVENAVEAMPLGGLIHVSNRADGDEVEIAVEDDGVGMAPEVRARMFDPFFTTRGSRSTGLGLSVVYGIVQRLGGRIGVRSAPGRGTRIEIRLPLAPALSPPAPAVAAAGEIAAAPGAPARRVLVVDDEPAVRDLLADIVVSLGHEPTVVALGRDGVDAFARERHDLVLTDLGLPDVSGWEVVREVRSLDPEVCIAVVTGWGEQTEAALVRDSGADALIGKPFSIEEVAAVIARAAQPRRGPGESPRAAA